MSQTTFLSRELTTLAAVPGALQAAARTVRARSPVTAADSCAEAARMLEELGLSVATGLEAVNALLTGVVFLEEDPGNGEVEFEPDDGTEPPGHA